MDLNEKQSKLLKEVKCLLKDIDGELHFCLPHSSKRTDIRDMLEWLETGEPVGSFEVLYDNEQESENTEGADNREGFWSSPLESILDQPDMVTQTMLKLDQHHGEELIYEPLICEVGKPFYFTLPKHRCQGEFEAFVILFCHYLRYMEELSWEEIRPETVDNLIDDKLIYSVAMCCESIVPAEAVKSETHWHINVALDDILINSGNPDVGIIHNGIRLEIDENYEPPISPLIHNALQLELDNDNPLFFFETENEYVLFGS
ncbi:hypothetical protein [Photobacterium kasasachensis]|uniref:hypothetical protein n=1 Tax=Photobacterium kasasachensis TaxID=2910240 RepID=UPI003D0D2128